MRCWLCGVEPDDVHEIVGFDGPDRQIPVWPDGDHSHAVRPPSPAELEQAGHETLMRIVDLTDLRPMSERLLLPSETIR